MAYINGNKVLSVVRTAYVSDAEQDLVARYNLGAFDSVSESGGITTITRQTGYIDLGTLSFTIRGDGTFYGSTNSNLALCIEGEGVCNKYILGNPYVIQDNKIFYIYVDLGETRILIRDTTVSNANFTGLLQYKLATPYTEQVITNRPLNTLDQNGSQWLRKEWEKGLQLWDEEWKLGYIGASTGIEESGNQVISKNFIKVNTNTTYYIKASGTINRLFLYDINKQFIRNIYINGNNKTFNSDNAYYIKFVCDVSYGTTYNYDIMLNEGDHAYPYQPYYGGIVRDSLVKFVFSLDSDNPPATYGDWSLFGEMSTPQGGSIYLWERLDV